MLHFKPQAGVFGDPIPFYWDGQYHLFHLIGRADGQAGHYWGHAVSRDLLHWEELPAAVPLGRPGEPDEHVCGTGSVIEKDGRFYLFYLGRRLTEYGQRCETMCLSTSDDLIHWTKHPDNPISVPDPRLYEWGGWRDGHVFWNEEAGCYWMPITAHLRSGPWERRGCLALATSPDLIHWQTQPNPFWAPHLTGRPLECPDVFQWNDWWYLIYFADGGTRYRMARQVTGPWLKPAHDSFGGNYIAAGKTATDGQERWLFAFLRGHQGETDGGVPTAQDVMALPRRLVQNADGTLSVAGPPNLESVCGEAVAPSFTNMLGEWTTRDDGLYGGCRDGLAYTVAKATPSNCVIDAQVRLGREAGHVGLALRTEQDLRPGYVIWIVPDAEEIRYTRLPGWYGHGAIVTQPYACPGEHSFTISIVLDGTTLEAFIDGQVAIAGRMYDSSDGKLALLVQDGTATFESVTIRLLRA